MLSTGQMAQLLPRDRPYKVADSHGLYVLVSTSGARLWRLNYRFRGKQQTLALGQFPEVSLTEARLRRDAARAAIREGADPGRRKATVSGTTFEAAARAWHRSRDDLSPKYHAQILRRLEQDLFPSLGTLPVAMVTRGDIRAALEPVEARVPETAKRLRQYISAIFDHAGEKDDSIADPTPPRRRKTRVEAIKHHSALLDRSDVGEFLIALDAYGDPVTRAALLFTILTAARTSETLGARWREIESQFSEEKAVWRVPASRMKRRRAHLVPLSRPAGRVLVQAMKFGGEQLIFPGRDGELSQNTMLFAIYNMGFRGRATVHGFRRTFSTWANEAGHNPDAIELALAHVQGGIRGVYNAAKLMDQRRELLAWWADQLAEEKAKAERRSARRAR